jgi:predicted transcriptional regulator
MQRKGRTVKTATIPSLRVDPRLRKAAERVLTEGETLSGFVEQSIRESVERRQAQSEFIARGLVAREEVLRTGKTIPAAEVLAKIEQKILVARAKALRRREL